MSDSRTVTRLALLVPGDRRLQEASVPGEWIENPGDGSFADSFSFGTVAREVQEKVDAASGALLVRLGDDLLAGRERVIAAVEELRRHGALAVRLEQSKVGWAVDQWLELVGSADPWSVHRGAVAMLVSERRVESCGMHAFSLPDARVDLATGSQEEGQELLSVLNVYQIAEDPLLLSGQTFSPTSQAPRRVVQRWPDDGYPADHWCHNPYGVWRFGPPGGQGRPQKELYPHFMPALVVLLRALEEKNGTLTRVQVEEVRDRAVCIALAHRDAQRLERTRGYADIDPELAWEQWSLVSANLRSDAGRRL